MPSGSDQGEDLTLTQAAKMLGVSPKTLLRWATSGRIPSTVTSDGRRMFRRSDLLKGSVSMDELPGEEE